MKTALRTLMTIMVLAAMITQPMMANAASAPLTQDDKLAILKLRDLVRQNERIISGSKTVEAQLAHAEVVCASGCPTSSLIPVFKTIDFLASGTVTLALLYRFFAEMDDWGGGGPNPFFTLKRMSVKIMLGGTLAWGANMLASSVAAAANKSQINSKQLEALRAKVAKNREEVERNAGEIAHIESSLSAKMEIEELLQLVK